MDRLGYTVQVGEACTVLGAQFGRETENHVRSTIRTDNCITFCVYNSGEELCIVMGTRLEGGFVCHVGYMFGCDSVYRVGYAVRLGNFVPCWYIVRQGI